MKGKDLRNLFIGGILGTLSIGALAATAVPNTFQPGTSIKAADVNANFSTLQGGLNALEAKFPLKTADLGDGIVTAPKLATQNPVANGKFLSYNGQGLVWADGTAGTVGPQGPKGDPGTNGNTVLSGSGAPTASLGANGDFYLDSAASVLYGPKANNVWPTSGTSLKGPQGNTGAQGAPGPQGQPGVSGYQQVVSTLSNQTLGAFGENVQFVNCPTGKRVVGGGFIVFNAVGRWLNGTNGPSSDTQWVVALENFSNATITAGQINIYAICVAAN